MDEWIEGTCYECKKQTEDPEAYFHVECAIKRDKENKERKNANKNKQKI